MSLVNPVGNANIWARLRGAVPGVALPNTFALLDSAGNLGALGPFKKIFLDPVNGNDANDGLGVSRAVQSLSVAYGLLTAGKNETLVLIGNGAASGTLRVDAAFTWAKDATHMVGVCSPALFSQRARIAPTASTAAFTPFFTISGNGCLFQNLQWWHGFTVGAATQVNLVVSGNRNVFINCHIAGMGDTDSASAGGAGSRSLKLGGAGAGENLFLDCVIGIDTVTRSAANASIEFHGGATRNVFRRCIFPFMASAATPLAVIGSAAGCLDRFNHFDECQFVNAIKSTSTQITALATLAAAAGGLLLFTNPTLVGITGFGSDATTRAQEYITGVASGSTTTGIGYNPSA
jgi:hypothetical protein